MDDIKIIQPRPTAIVAALYTLHDLDADETTVRVRASGGLPAPRTTTKSHPTLAELP